jgi:hypothetical protein
VLQGIRGLLPVKSILREYLNNENEDEDDSDDEKEKEKEKPKAKVEPEAEEKVEPEAEEKVEDKVEDKVEPVAEEAKPLPVVEPVAEEAKPLPVVEPVTEEAKLEPQAEVKVEPKEQPLTQNQATQPTIYIDTKPSVTFSQEHIMFDSDNLENNEIHDIPFAEAELRVDEDDDEDDIESVKISDEFLPMEADEIL